MGTSDGRMEFEDPVSQRVFVRLDLSVVPGGQEVAGSNPVVPRFKSLRGNDLREAELGKSAG